MSQTILTSFGKLEAAMLDGLTHASETLFMVAARTDMALPFIDATDEQRARLCQLVSAVRNHGKSIRRSRKRLTRRLERIEAAGKPDASKRAAEDRFGSGLDRATGDEPTADQPIRGHVEPRVRTEGDGPIVQIVVPRGTRVEAEFAN